MAGGAIAAAGWISASENKYFRKLLAGRVPYIIVFMMPILNIMHDYYLALHNGGTWADTITMVQAN
jgi:hypothetical protein